MGQPSVDLSLLNIESLAVCRVTIAAVFTIASIAKVATYRQFEYTLSKFGVPSRLWPAIVLAELSVPMTILSGWPTPFVGFLIATAILIAFSIAIVRAIGGGVVAPCGCFGFSEEPIGYSDVGRNALLAGLAVIGGALSVTTTTHAAAMTVDQWLLAILIGLAVAPMFVFFTDLTRILTAH